MSGFPLTRARARAHTQVLIRSQDAHCRPTTTTHRHAQRTEKNTHTQFRQLPPQPPADKSETVVRWLNITGSQTLWHARTRTTPTHTHTRSRSRCTWFDGSKLSAAVAVVAGALNQPASERVLYVVAEFSPAGPERTRHGRTCPHPPTKLLPPPSTPYAPLRTEHTHTHTRTHNTHSLMHTHTWRVKRTLARTGWN